ncbi:MAG: BamA/TamA family outer membrane protein, partial [Bacteroidales bacterium]|nr:BamA/TamA family outer membrane protein [Bacteroidales bacterium]
KIDSPIRSNEASVSASISFPKFLGLPYSIFTGPNIPRTEVSGSFNYQDRTEYKRNIASLTYGYSGTFLKRYRFLLNIPRVSYVHLYTLDPEFKQMLERNPFMRYAYQDHLDAGVGGTLHYTTNNDVVPKTSYHFWQVNVDLSGNVISMFDRFMPRSEQGQALILSTPYTQYVRGEFSVGQTLRFGKSDAHALSYRFLIGAGYPYGNSQAMPFEKQFYCGGANSMRGWQARALGPGSQALDTSFSIPSQTGEAKLEFDVEYRMPIFWKIEGALFAECGNVWNIRNSEPEASVRTFYKTLAADWGLGVRLNLDFILVRIDVGFQTYDPVAAAWYGPGKWFTGKSCVHFGVGYPF